MGSLQIRQTRCLHLSLLCTTCIIHYTVNGLRFDIFCAKRVDIERHQHPPCRDCIVKHAQRAANYQAAIIYGDAALNRTRKYQVLLVEDGRLRRKKELNSWWWTGWVDSQHLRLSSICWPVVAQGSAHYPNVCVCQTDWNALICPDRNTVRIRHPALNQMMRKVQMGTLKTWLMNMIFKVILDITYDLSFWTLHVTCSRVYYIWLVSWTLYDLSSRTLCMTCYLGHYMTCYLGHDVWVVILDIIWLVILDIMHELSSWTLDLSSWTLFRTCHFGHDIWLVLLYIIYDLFSWTLYDFHLGHYVWLVILDIIWLVILDMMYELLSLTLYDLSSWTLDLSSWTLFRTCHFGHDIWLVILDII